MAYVTADGKELLENMFEKFKIELEGDENTMENDKRRFNNILGLAMEVDGSENIVEEAVKIFEGRWCK